MKKLLNDCVDLTSHQRGKKKRFKWNEGKFCRFLLPKARFSPVKGSTTMFTKSFWNSLCSPGSRGCRLMDLMLVHTTRTTLSSWWNPGVWPIGCPIHQTSTGWTSLSGSFFKQKPRPCPTPIWPTYVGPLLHNGNGDWWNTSAIPPVHSTTPRRLPWHKMSPSLKRWTASSPTSTSQHFSLLT